MVIHMLDQDYFFSPGLFFFKKYYFPNALPHWLYMVNAYIIDYSLFILDCRCYFGDG